MASDRLARPAVLGARGRVLIGLAIAAVWAFWHLGLDLADLVANEGGLNILRDFASRAFTPALESEGRFVPEGAPPLLVLGLKAAWTTFVFAAAGVSLALPFALVFGLLGSTAWWPEERPGGVGLAARLWRRALGPALFATTRATMVLLRSIHELLWAVLLLAAFGLSEIAAVIAIALPYAGFLGKIFAEMIDETPRDAAAALTAAGARGPQVFAFGLLTRALPDLTAYVFYRFECALRSSAVLGFFGFETLGLYLKQSFKAMNFGETWTYLYILIALVALFDWWSGVLRRRMAS